MNYYDNVKDTVKGKNSDGGSNASYDTLKEAAEETDVEADEEKGDDTPIEVLEDGGLQQKTQESKEKRSKSSESNSNQGGNPLTGKEEGSGGVESEDIRSLEERLDKIIDQNERMIQILESFGS